MYQDKCHNSDECLNIFLFQNLKHMVPWQMEMELTKIQKFTPHHQLLLVKSCRNQLSLHANSDNNYTFHYSKMLDIRPIPFIGQFTLESGTQDALLNNETHWIKRKILIKLKFHLFTFFKQHLFSYSWIKMSIYRYLHCMYPWITYLRNCFFLPNLIWQFILYLLSLS